MTGTVNERVKVFGLDFASLSFRAFDAMEKEAPIHNEPKFGKIAEHAVLEQVQRSVDKIYGAVSLPEFIPVTDEGQLDEDRFEEMSDPYTGDTRRKFESEIFGNPVLHKGIKNRSAAFLRKGFHLELEVTSPRGEDGKLLTPEEKQAMLDEQMAAMQSHLGELERWAHSDRINLLKRMKAANVMTFAQGRSLTMVFPAISELQPGKLPVSLRSISWEDIGNPIIDKDYWVRVGIRVLNMGDDKLVALNDECVYITDDAWGLRKDSDFYGASSLESVLQTSRIFTKLVNYDIAKAVVAGYMSKIFIKVNVDGLDESTRDQRLLDVANRIVASGVDVLTLEDGLEVTIQPVKVDTDMIVRLFDKLNDLLIGATGSTKSQMGVTDGLTRDNATIQEIVFMKYVRNVDEELITTPFENQLLTPLLAHLAGKKPDELAVKVNIISEDEDPEQRDRKVQQEKRMAQAGQVQQLQDPRLEGKQEEMDEAKDEPDIEQAMKQPDAKGKPFGASSLSLEERRIRAMEADAEATRRLADKLDELYPKPRRKKSNKP